MLTGRPFPEGGKGATKSGVSREGLGTPVTAFFTGARSAEVETSIAGEYLRWADFAGLDTGQCARGVVGSFVDWPAQVLQGVQHWPVQLVERCVVARKAGTHHRVSKRTRPPIFPAV